MLKHPDELDIRSALKADHDANGCIGFRDVIVRIQPSTLLVFRDTPASLIEISECHDERRTKRVCGILEKGRDDLLRGARNVLDESLIRLVALFCHEAI